jgi:hypothetical protein
MAIITPPQPDTIQIKGTTIVSPFGIDALVNGVDPHGETQINSVLVQSPNTIRIKGTNVASLSEELLVNGVFPIVGIGVNKVAVAKATSPTALIVGTVTASGVTTSGVSTFNGSGLVQPTVDGICWTLKNHAGTTYATMATNPGGATLNLISTLGGGTALTADRARILTITGYGTNNNATTGAGAVCMFGTVNLITQSAIINATNINASLQQQGMWRIAWNAKVTTAATTSSTLGGTTGFQVVYTDLDDNVVVTTPIWYGGGNNGAAPTSASLNTTQTQLSGVISVNAKLAIPIQYLFGYTSSGATAMVYSLHINMEWLG